MATKQEHGLSASSEVTVRVITDLSTPPTSVSGTVCARLFPGGYWRECRGLLQLAWPMVLIQLLQFSPGLIATIFCGHLGKTELDAVALANTLINVTGISIGVGLSAACDTYFAQIYGSPNRQDLGIYLQKSLLVLPLALFPCWAIHINAEGMLILFGQDPGVAKLAGSYMLWFTPGLLCFFFYCCFAKYIQCQNIIIPNLCVGVLANGVCVLSHYVTIYPLDMGTDGSAISIVLTYLAMLVFTLVYIFGSKCYIGTWNGWSYRCLEGWWEFIKLGIFGLLMICIEWWSFEIGTFLSGVLGTTELAAQTILFQIESVTYMLPLGLGISASIRVGQFLGDGDAISAKTSARVAITVVWVTGATVAILIASLKDYLPFIFTNDREVTDLASSLLPILAVYMVFDSNNGVIAGIIRGSGRQRLGSICIAFCYAGALSVGIPLMFLTSLRVAGLWISLAGALFVESIIFLTLIQRTNWDNLVEKARDRTCKENKVETIDDETTALLGSSESERVLGKNKIYGSPVTSPEPRGTSGKKLVLEKLLALLIVVTIFLSGLFVRLFVELPKTTAAINITNATLSLQTPDMFS